MALVRPIATTDWQYAQSRHKHLPKVPFSILTSGKSRSGKEVLLANVITDFYRDAFSAIYVFAPTVHLDDTFKLIEHHGYRHLKQKKPFMFDQYSESIISEIVE